MNWIVKCSGHARIGDILSGHALRIALESHSFLMHMRKRERREQVRNNMDRFILILFVIAMAWWMFGTKK